MSLSSIAEHNPHPYRKGLDYATGTGDKGLCEFLPFLPQCCWEFIKAERKKAMRCCKVGVTSRELG